MKYISQISCIKTIEHKQFLYIQAHESIKTVEISMGIRFRGSKKLNLEQLKELNNHLAQIIQTFEVTNE